MPRARLVRQFCRRQREVADNLPGIGRVRDSKDPAGRAPGFAPAAWRDFVAEVANRRNPVRQWQPDRTGVSRAGRAGSRPAAGPARSGGGWSGRGDAAGTGRAGR
ncbi:DUF397 domain-containing protein [Plantactinospora sp. WMMB782]|uniref:DUF397 domain-containing protein n=1 Tax=Plantactinospora sp. WMMB782 TaxID=3404121 RepID=UPI003B9649EF